MSKFINVKILRYDPDKDKAPHFQSYKVELRRPGMLLLTVLNQIKWELDPPPPPPPPPFIPQVLP